MTPPKCRICGIREHNHRCHGGTPAQRVEERRRHELMAGRVADPGPPEQPAHSPPVPDPPPTKIGIGTALAANLPKRTSWHDDSDAAGEPVEVRDYSRKPARFYAPPGSCVYCDRRRAEAARSMRAIRERGTDA